VSRSNPSPEAKLALDACGIVDFNKDDLGLTFDFGMDVVAAMARVTPARDIKDYVPVGDVPVIDTDTPAWVIRTSGWLRLGPFVNGPTENPTCIVLADRWDDPGWYQTGDYKDGDQLITQLPMPPPSKGLPPLGP
jgi:hypothetical protein